MEFAFPWPYSQGEWLAWSGAAATVAFGLFFMFAPGFGFRALRLQPRAERPEALAEARATIGGFYVGFGLCAILFAQPLIYMTLGFAWAVSAFGRVISMLSDRGATAYNFAMLIVSLVLAALPLAFAIGFVP